MGNTNKLHTYTFVNTKTCHNGGRYTHGQPHAPCAIPIMYRAIVFDAGPKSDYSCCSEANNVLEPNYPIMTHCAPHIFRVDSPITNYGWCFKTRQLPSTQVNRDITSCFIQLLLDVRSHLLLPSSSRSICLSICTAVDSTLLLTDSIIVSQSLPFSICV